MTLLVKLIYLGIVAIPLLALMIGIRKPSMQYILNLEKYA